MIGPWWAVAALAQPVEDPAPSDFRSHLDQARFFIRKQWFGDAAEELERAVATEDGRLDPEAWFLLAQVRYELRDLPGARHAADRALVHSRDPEQARQAHELLLYFSERFGVVTVEPPNPGMRSSLEIVLQSAIFDPELKNWLNDLAARVAEPVVLPIELGLPAGRYTINGVPVEVGPGSQAAIVPPVRAAGPQPLQLLQLELGLGVTQTSGTGDQLLPAPTGELSVGLPVGPVIAGVMVAWAPQAWLLRLGGLGFGAAGGSFGARLGVEIPGTHPLILRPSATWRLSRLPGLEVGCAQTGDVWTCEREAPVRQLLVYTTGTAHLVGAELAVLYQDRRTRARGLGAGLKVSGDAVFGQLPLRATAEGPDGAVEFVVAPYDRPFRGFDLRALGTLAWTF